MHRTLGAIRAAHNLSSSSKGKESSKGRDRSPSPTSPRPPGTARTDKSSKRSTSDEYSNPGSSNSNRDADIVSTIQQTEVSMLQEEMKNATLRISQTVRNMDNISLYDTKSYSASGDRRSNQMKFIQDQCERAQSAMPIEFYARQLHYKQVARNIIEVDERIEYNARTWKRTLRELGIEDYDVPVKVIVEDGAADATKTKQLQPESLTQNVPEGEEKSTATEAPPQPEVNVVKERFKTKYSDGYDSDELEAMGKQIEEFMLVKLGDDENSNLEMRGKCGKYSERAIANIRKALGMEKSKIDEEMATMTEDIKQKESTLTNLRNQTDALEAEIKDLSSTEMIVREVVDNRFKSTINNMNDHILKQEQDKLELKEVIDNLDLQRKKVLIMFDEIRNRRLRSDPFIRKRAQDLVRGLMQRLDDKEIKLQEEREAIIRENFKTVLDNRAMYQDFVRKISLMEDVFASTVKDIASNIERIAREKVDYTSKARVLKVKDEEVTKQLQKIESVMSEYARGERRKAAIENKKREMRKEQPVNDMNALSTENYINNLSQQYFGTNIYGSGNADDSSSDSSDTEGAASDTSSNNSSSRSTPQQLHQKKISKVNKKKAATTNKLKRKKLKESLAEDDSDFEDENSDDNEQSSPNSALLHNSLAEALAALENAQPLASVGILSSNTEVQLTDPHVESVLGVVTEEEKRQGMIKHSLGKIMTIDEQLRLSPEFARLITPPAPAANGNLPLGVDRSNLKSPPISLSNASSKPGSKPGSASSNLDNPAIMLTAVRFTPLNIDEVDADIVVTQTGETGSDEDTGGGGRNYGSASSPTRVSVLRNAGNSGGRSPSHRQQQLQNQQKNGQRIHSISSTLCTACYVKLHQDFMKKGPNSVYSRVTGPQVSVLKKQSILWEKTAPTKRDKINVVIGDEHFKFTVDEAIKVVIESLEKLRDKDLIENAVAVKIRQLLIDVSASLQLQKLSDENASIQYRLHKICMALIRAVFVHAPKTLLVQNTRALFAETISCIFAVLGIVFNVTLSFWEPKVKPSLSGIHGAWVDHVTRELVDIVMSHGVQNRRHPQHKHPSSRHMKRRFSRKMSNVTAASLSRMSNVSDHSSDIEEEFDGNGHLADPVALLGSMVSLLQRSFTSSQPDNVIAPTLNIVMQEIRHLVPELITKEQAQTMNASDSSSTIVTIPGVSAEVGREPKIDEEKEEEEDENETNEHEDKEDTISGGEEKPQQSDNEITEAHVSTETAAENAGDAVNTKKPKFSSKKKKDKGKATKDTSQSKGAPTETSAIREAAKKAIEKQSDDDLFHKPPSERTFDLIHRNALGMINVFLVAVFQSSDIPGDEVMRMIEQVKREGAEIGNVKSSFSISKPVMNVEKLDDFLAELCFPQILPGLLTVELMKRVIEQDISRRIFLEKIMNRDKNVLDLQFLNVNMPVTAELHMHSLHRELENNSRGDSPSNKQRKFNHRPHGSMSERPKLEQVTAQEAIVNPHHPQHAAAFQSDNVKSTRESLIDVQKKSLLPVLFKRRESMMGGAGDNAFSMMEAFDDAMNAKKRGSVMMSIAANTTTNTTGKRTPERLRSVIVYDANAVDANNNNLPGRSVVNKSQMLVGGSSVTGSGRKNANIMDALNFVRRQDAAGVWNPAEIENDIPGLHKPEQSLDISSSRHSAFIRNIHDQWISERENYILHLCQQINQAIRVPYTTKAVNEDGETISEAPKVLPLPEPLVQKILAYIENLRKIIRARRPDGYQLIKSYEQSFKQCLIDLRMAQKKILSIVNALTFPMKRRLMWLQEKLDQVLKENVQIAKTIEEQKSKTIHTKRDVDDISKSLQIIIQETASSSFNQTINLLKHSLEVQRMILEYANEEFVSKVRRLKERQATFEHILESMKAEFNKLVGLGQGLRHARHSLRLTSRFGTPEHLHGTDNFFPEEVNMQSLDEELHAQLEEEHRIRRETMEARQNAANITLDTSIDDLMDPFVGAEAALQHQAMHLTRRKQTQRTHGAKSNNNKKRQPFRSSASSSGKSQHHGSYGDSSRDGSIAVASGKPKKKFHSYLLQENNDANNSASFMHFTKRWKGLMHQSRKIAMEKALENIRNQERRQNALTKEPKLFGFGKRIDEGLNAIQEKREEVKRKFEEWKQDAYKERSRAFSTSDAGGKTFDEIMDHHRREAFSRGVFLQSIAEGEEYPEAVMQSRLHSAVAITSQYHNDNVLPNNFFGRQHVVVTPSGTTTTIPAFIATPINRSGNISTVSTPQITSTPGIPPEPVSDDKARTLAEEIRNFENSFRDSERDTEDIRLYKSQQQHDWHRGIISMNLAGNPVKVSIPQSNVKTREFLRSWKHEPFQIRYDVDSKKPSELTPANIRKLLNIQEQILRRNASLPKDTPTLPSNNPINPEISVVTNTEEEINQAAALAGLAGPVSTSTVTSSDVEDDKSVTKKIKKITMVYNKDTQQAEVIEEDRSLDRPVSITLPKLTPSVSFKAKESLKADVSDEEKDLRPGSASENILFSSSPMSSSSPPMLTRAGSQRKSILELLQPVFPTTIAPLPGQEIIHMGGRRQKRQEKLKQKRQQQLNEEEDVKKQRLLARQARMARKKAKRMAARAKASLDIVTEEEEENTETDEDEDEENSEDDGDVDEGGIDEEGNHSAKRGRKDKSSIEFDDELLDDDNDDHSDVDNEDEDIVTDPPESRDVHHRQSSPSSFFKHGHRHHQFVEDGTQTYVSHASSSRGSSRSSSRGSSRGGRPPHLGKIARQEGVRGSILRSKKEPVKHYRRLHAQSNLEEIKAAVAKQNKHNRVHSHDAKNEEEERNDSDDVDNEANDSETDTFALENTQEYIELRSFLHDKIHKNIRALIEATQQQYKTTKKQQQLQRRASSRPSSQSETHDTGDQLNARASVVSPQRARSTTQHHQQLQQQLLQHQQQHHFHVINANNNDVNSNNTDTAENKAPVLGFSNESLPSTEKQPPVLTKRMTLLPPPYAAAANNIHNADNNSSPRKITSSSSSHHRHRKLTYQQHLPNTHRHNNNALGDQSHLLHRARKSKYHRLGQQQSQLEDDDDAWKAQVFSFLFGKHAETIKDIREIDLFYIPEEETFSTHSFKFTDAELEQKKQDGTLAAILANPLYNEDLAVDMQAWNEQQLNAYLHMLNLKKDEDWQRLVQDEDEKERKLGRRINEHVGTIVDNISKVSQETQSRLEKRPTSSSFAFPASFNAAAANTANANSFLLNGVSNATQVAYNNLLQTTNVGKMSVTAALNAIQAPQPVVYQYPRNSTIVNHTNNNNNNNNNDNVTNIASKNDSNPSQTDSDFVETPADTNKSSRNSANTNWMSQFRSQSIPSSSVNNHQVVSGSKAMSGEMSLLKEQMAAATSLLLSSVSEHDPAADDHDDKEAVTTVTDTAAAVSHPNNVGKENRGITGDILNENFVYSKNSPLAIPETAATRAYRATNRQSLLALNTAKLSSMLAQQKVQTIDENLQMKLKKQQHLFDQDLSPTIVVDQINPTINPTKAGSPNSNNNNNNSSARSSATSPNGQEKFVNGRARPSLTSPNHSNPTTDPTSSSPSRSLPVMSLSMFHQQQYVDVDNASLTVTTANDGTSSFALATTSNTNNTTMNSRHSGVSVKRPFIPHRPALPLATTSTSTNVTSTSSTLQNTSSDDAASLTSRTARFTMMEQMKEKLQESFATLSPNVSQPATPATQQRTTSSNNTNNVAPGYALGYFPTPPSSSESTSSHDPTVYNHVNPVSSGGVGVPVTPSSPVSQNTPRTTALSQRRKQLQKQQELPLSS